jgi:phenylalanyl-tRNA synthetase beta chain
VPLLNPLSAEESHLRDDLLTGLIRRVEHNWAHGVRSIRLYEIGTTFRMSGGPVPEEEVRLAAVFTGPSRPPHWSEQIRAYDLWDLKGLMAEIGEGLADLVDIRARSSDNGILDQDEGFAVVARSGVQLGVGGRVVWRAIDAPKWAEPVWALEFALQVTEGRMGAVFTELPVFPPVDRDLALLVPAGVSASDVERIIRVRAGDLLQAVWPFDLYEGEGVAAGARSIAWRLRFRHPERTLNDADVESPLSQILSGLKEELGVKRR